MSRILSPNPIVLTLTYSELNHQVDFKTSKELPLLVLIQIFCQIITTLIAAGPTLGDAILKGGVTGGAATPQGGPNDGNKTK